ncbi:MAG: tetratricopeptide repeat protein [Betaproteobacteria bacterium]
MRREALLGEAQAARNAGELSLARRLCADLLALDSRDAAALVLLAGIAADAGNAAEGRRAAERALALDPDSGPAHYAMGRAYELEGAFPAAEASYRESLRLDSRQARTHNNLGCVLHMQGRLEEALACYRAAIEFDPALPEARHNYASIARDAGGIRHAAAGYRLQVQANPRNADAWTNLGNALRELGQIDEAMDAFGHAIGVAPDHAEARFSRSLLMLLRGDYASGWREHEWRWRLPAHAPQLQRFGSPMWDGRAIAGGTILLHAEQGLGDTLQFVRFAAPVAARCARVVLECQSGLATLMRGVRGVDQVVAQGEPLPRYDAHAPLMSLPAILGVTLDTIPWDGPYVRPMHQGADAPPPLPPAEGLRVGLAWAGRPEQWDDRKRSISLDMLAPLSEVPGVTFYSLQKGAAAAQAANPPRGLRLIDLNGVTRNFSDASYIGQFDLVISVDTSVAHLAGAMGAPTWVLVAFAPDWRHHLGRADNPWYPTMRLFRQPADGDWRGAIAALAAALHALAARSVDRRGPRAP